ncbi:hypothetical protein [Streptomyces montanisoli]|uniref:Uncharacterized protein n=1 Tax=Streptomyces montanisoli TaxID=2798581 RepID=A0A940MCQ7_9ACTN|nr:hypothetical protein [Streptomyces montanisoli]MBP0457976.1 hypothetical protein [Streptomyces montanisoli]
MKIKRVDIENFCCLRGLDVSSTPSPRSSARRASASPPSSAPWTGSSTARRGGNLGEEDAHSASETKRIRVEVEFDGLTTSDRAAPGHYVPGGVEILSI